jgi:hypothetical protein
VLEALDPAAGDRRGELRLALEAPSDPRGHDLVAAALAEEHDAVDVRGLVDGAQERLEPPDQGALGVGRAARSAKGGLGFGQDALLLAVEHRGEQLVLRGEAVIDHRLRDAGGLGDGVHRRAVEPVLQEEVVRRIQHEGPATLGPQVGRALPSDRSFSLLAHGHSYLW